MIYQLTAFYGETATWVNEGRAEITVCIDFNKASNTCLYNILIEKLRKSGLDEWTVGWIENWLDQRVIISETRSD